MPLALGLDTTEIVTYKKGYLWAGVVVPAGGAEMTIDASGYPDATENPDAIQMGFTEGGATLEISRKMENRYADEIKSPILTVVSEIGMKISGGLLQVLDFDILVKLSKGVLTKTTPTGKNKLTVGDVAMTYDGVAFIFEYATGKFACWHLYQAFQTEPISMDVGRTKQTMTKFTFEGVGIPSRAAADQVGAIWKQNPS